MRNEKIDGKSLPNPEGWHVYRNVSEGERCDPIWGSSILNSGERIPHKLCFGVSEQNTKKVLDGIGFLVSLLRGVSIRCRLFFFIPVRDVL